jgi:hypothetical protein
MKQARFLIVAAAVAALALLPGTAGAASKAVQSIPWRGRFAVLGMVVLSAVLLLFIGQSPPASAASATVTATGRFVFVDDLGRTIGVRGAEVRLCDNDGAFGCPIMNELITDTPTGFTDNNGFFSLTGTGGDYSETSRTRG